MDKLEELQDLMVRTGACVRAIPMSVREIVEARHASDKCYEKPAYVKKEVKFLEGWGREMFVAERRPEHAGMFLVETKQGTMASVRFSGKKYYASLDKVLAALRNEVE